MSNHPNTRGIYPTPLTLTLSYRDYAQYTASEAATNLLATYPSLSPAYLADLIAAVYQTSFQSGADLQSSLPLEIQNDSAIDAAVAYAYPPINSFAPLQELTVAGVGYADKLQHSAGSSPRMLIRDTIPPGGNNMYGSPDVIVSPQRIPDYKTYYGVNDDSAWQRDFTSGMQVEVGQPSYLYVRLQNTGNVPIVPYVSIWYLPYGTVMHFDKLWPVGHHFGADPLIPQQKDVIEFVWSGPREASHFCFIGIVESVRDPVVVPPQIDANSLPAFLKTHDNVAWHNFSGVNVAPDQTFINLPAFKASPVPGHESHLVLSIAPNSKVAAFPGGSAVQVSADNDELPVVVLDDAPQDNQKRIIITPKLALGAETTIDMTLDLSAPIKETLQIVVSQIAGSTEAGHVSFKIDTADQAQLLN